MPPHCAARGSPLDAVLNPELILMSGEPIKQQLLPRRRGLVSSRLRDVHILYVVLCATTTVDLKSAGIQPKSSSEVLR